MDRIHGARDSGGRRALVSANPAGLSQRRSGGHWVRGGPVAWSPVNGAPGGAATRELGNPPAGLGEPPPAADISRDRRVWGHHGQRTRGDPAELPRHLAVGYGGITSGDFLAAGQTHRNQNKDFRNKTKRGEWAPLTVRSGLLLRCTHKGGYRNTRT